MAKGQRDPPPSKNKQKKNLKGGLVSKGKCKALIQAQMVKGSDESVYGEQKNPGCTL